MAHPTAAKGNTSWSEWLIGERRAQLDATERRRRPMTTPVMAPRRVTGERGCHGTPQKAYVQVRQGT